MLSIVIGSESYHYTDGKNGYLSAKKKRTAVSSIGYNPTKLFDGNWSLTKEKNKNNCTLLMQPPVL